MPLRNKETLMLLKPHSRLIFVGDSVTDMGRSGGRGAGEVSQGLFDPLGKGYPNFVNAILNGWSPELHIHVINSGNSGNNVRNLLARWETDVLAFKPDWVSVCIGINDVWRQFDSPGQPEEAVPLEEYESGLEKLVEMTLPKGCGMNFMTPYFIESNAQDAMRTRMDEYGAAMKRVAARHDLVCVDLQTAFCEALEHQYSGYYTWDRIHPNCAGSALMARAFLKAMGYNAIN